MDYLVARGNEEIPIERIATDLKIDKKIVASIASRLVSRGAISRTSRGVYVHKQLSVKSSTVEAILAMLQKTVTKTFGKQIAEKVDISRIKDRKSIESLEEAVVRLRKVLGGAGANNIFRLVVKRVAKPSERKYILTRLDVSS
jgi:Mn-dependent DtxR family transcriptional regulator